MDDNSRLEADLSIARHAGPGAWAYPLLVVLVAIGTPLAREHSGLFLFTFLSLLATGATRFFLARRLLKAPPELVKGGKLALLATILGQAGLWGLFSGLMLYSESLQWTSMLVMIITAGLSSSGSSVLVSNIRFMRVFHLALLAPSALAALATQWYVVVAVIVLYGVQLSLHGQRQSDWFWHMLKDKDELAHRSAELELARQEAVAGSQAKSAFLSMMSHEIRTPLNGVIGMTGLLMDTPLNSEQQEFAAVAKSSGEALLNVINDVLDFSKIEAGRLEFENLDFDLRACIEEVADLVAFRAQEKNLELPLLIRQDLPERVHGDPGRFRQILLNLMTNAVKFTEKGEILVRAGLEPNQPAQGPWRVRVDVSDTGIGIPEDRRKALFAPFVQSDSSTSRKFGGTGLGLAICKRLVEGQGGSITLESFVGEGSVFSFVLPFGAPEQMTAPEFPLADIRGLKVLVVDDNSTNRQVFREQLSAWGCVCQECARPEQVLPLLTQEAHGPAPFDVVLLDFQMPGMNGLDLAARIRDTPAMAEVALILATSAPQRGDAKKLQSCRVDGYLTKPVKRHALFTALAATRGRSGGAEAQRPLVTVHSLRENPPTRRGRVLVAEDNHVNQKLISRLLEKLGYGCDLAANGFEVLAALDRKPYDVVLMDCQMPEMDGLEATRRIRLRTDSTREIAILAVSAGVTQEERQQCQAAGMNDFLGKPIETARLEALLKKFVPECPQPRLPQLPDLKEGQLKLVSGGDPEFERELVETYLEELKSILAELRSALESQDAARLRRSAHSLKSSSLYLGAARVSKLSEQLEHLAANGRLEEGRSVLTELIEAADVASTRLAATGTVSQSDPADE